MTIALLGAWNLLTGLTVGNFGTVLLSIVINGFVIITGLMEIYSMKQILNEVEFKKPGFSAIPLADLYALGTLTDEYSPGFMHKIKLDKFGMKLVLPISLLLIPLVSVILVAITGIFTASFNLKGILMMASATPVILNIFFLLFWALRCVCFWTLFKEQDLAKDKKKLVMILHVIFNLGPVVLYSQRADSKTAIWIRTTFPWIMGTDAPESESSGSSGTGNSAIKATQASRENDDFYQEQPKQAPVQRQQPVQQVQQQRQQQAQQVQQDEFAFEPEIVDSEEEI